MGIPGDAGTTQDAKSVATQFALAVLETLSVLTLNR
jgi:hypothetical protein